MHRLFVALRPPPPIRALLLALADGVAGARWQDDEQLHLTLRYIGEVERPVAEDVAAALSRVASPAPRMRLSAVGRFAGHGGALWAGVAPRDALSHLHRKVDQACVAAGLPPEQRAYLPHITLARLPRSLMGSPAIDNWLALHAALSSGAWTAGHLVLYESHLGRDGARYDAVARWPLAAAPSDGEH